MAEKKAAEAKTAKKEVKVSAKADVKAQPKTAKPASKADVKAQPKTAKPAPKTEAKVEPKSAKPVKPEEEKEGRVYHISKRKEERKWQVKAEGDAKALRLFWTQEEAIEYAKSVAGNQEGRIVIHKEDGSFRKLKY